MLVCCKICLWVAFWVAFVKVLVQIPDLLVASPYSPPSDIPALSISYCLAAEIKELTHVEEGLKIGGNF